MNREVHVRFCERFGGVTPPYLLDFIFIFKWEQLIIKLIINNSDLDSSV